MLIISVATLLSIAVALAVWRWHYAVYTLLAYVAVGGAVQLLLFDVKWIVLLKDILFVIPCYLCLVIMKGRPHIRLPRYFAFTIGLFVVVVVAQLFNPSGPPWTARLIGLKVWLFYLPLIAVGSTVAISERRIRDVLRVFLVVMWLPCLAGLAQWILSLTLGYQRAISLFYGVAASAASTQGYASFGVGSQGAQLIRIPATFSYPTQYYNYLLCAITAAWIAGIGEKSRRWRSFARASMMVGIVASIFSGIRSAFLFTPLLILLLYVLKRDARRIVGTVAVAAVLIAAGLSQSSLTLEDIASYTSDLTVMYAHVNGVSYVAHYLSPLGTGVGSGTNATRYVMDSDDLNPENYYAKAAHELGIPGLVAVVLLLTASIAVGFRDLRFLQNPGYRAFCIGVLALQITVLGYSFKATLLDYDPLNVLFWFLVGMALQLRRLDRPAWRPRFACSPPGTPVNQLTLAGHLGT
jgi:hypothetical protein